MTKLFIHRYVCPNCDAHTRADRIVPCFKCGTEMEHEERIAELDP